MPGKVFSATTDCCLRRCHDSFSSTVQKELFDRFYSLPSKESQDSFLSRCMTLSLEKPKRVRAEKQRQADRKKWTYGIPICAGKKLVCKTFLVHLYAVSLKRLENLQKKLMNDEGPEDKRGRHKNRKHALNPDVICLMKDHLESIESEFSHYSYNKSNLKYFTNPALNVKKLYKLFQLFYKKKTDEPLRLAYKTYHMLFNSKFHYGFARPKTDVCDFCTECKEKLRVDANDPCAVDYTLHQKKYKAHQKIRRDFIALAKQDPSILVLEFDYGQNYPLPKLSVNSQFYKRLLWLYIFNVHVFNDDSSFMYTFMETTKMQTLFVRWFITV